MTTHGITYFFNGICILIFIISAFAATFIFVYINPKEQLRVGKCLSEAHILNCNP